MLCFNHPNRSPGKPVGKKRTAPGGHNTESGTERRWTALKHFKGTWYYRGQRYATLHEALVSAWPK